MTFRGFRPNFVFRTIHDIDYEVLWRHGIRFICFDVDNTLGPMHCTTFDKATHDLLMRLIGRGFRIAFATNSTKNRDELAERYNAVICQPKRITRYHKEPRKPQQAFYQQLLDQLGEPDPATVVMIGDKLIADVLAARACDLAAILINPLGTDLAVEHLTLFRYRENFRLRRYGIKRAA